MPNPSEETEAQKDRNAPPNHAEPGCARPRRPVPHGLGPGTPWGCPRPLPRRGGRQDAGADRPAPGRGPRSCHVPTHHPRENGASRAEDSSRRAEVARGGRDAGAAGTGRTLGVLRAAEARARPVRWVGTWGTGLGEVAADRLFLQSVSQVQASVELPGEETEAQRRHLPEVTQAVSGNPGLPSARPATALDRHMQQMTSRRLGWTLAAQYS